jgi:CubicO group peptidase (beta-lactamase class C family)
MDRREFLGRTAFAFGPVFAAGCASSPRGSVAWPLVTDFKAKVPRLMAEFRVPGVSIAAIRNGKMVWRHPFGVKVAATNAPVTNDTIFEAGSMSKPVFAYVILKMHEKGVIDLDTPLTKYTPDRIITGDSRLDRITARHILCHASGFQNWRTTIEPLKIRFTPGSQYLYSGEGYFYLQSVLTHLKGKVDRTNCAKFEADLEVCATDFPEFMRCNLLAPFNMLSSGYVWNDLLQRHSARGHDKAGKPILWPRGTAPAAARYGSAGGLHTTPTDYAKFMIAVFNPPPADAFHLNHETISEMVRPHVKVVDGPYTSSWALGWQVQDNGIINHGGDNPGFHSHAVIYPRTKNGYVIMTNGDTGPELIKQVLFSPTNDLLMDA